MFIDHLELTNLRTIAHATLELNHRDRPKLGLNLPNINLLLGSNGTGKSSVLRAIALGILTPLIGNIGYVPYSLVRRDGDSSISEANAEVNLKLHLQDVGGERSRVGKEVKLVCNIVRKWSTEILEPGIEIDRTFWDAMYNTETPAFLLLAYGATRRVESSETFDSGTRSKSRHIRYQRVASLFEDHVSLTPLSSWLPKLESSNKGRFTQVRNLIHKLLPEPYGFEGKMENGEYVFNHGNQSIPFPALSDGYKAYLGWITDMLYHICMGCPSGKKLVDNYGIVLIDEIDLHLHPAWQRVVVPMIAAALPNIQFILTTHSPIVTGTLQSSNIFVVAEKEPGESTVSQFEEKVHGLTSEQVLLSSYFDLPSTRAPAVTNTIENLIADPNQGGTERAITALKILTRAGASPATPSGESKNPQNRVFITGTVRKKQKRALDMQNKLEVSKVSNMNITGPVRKKQKRALDMQNKLEVSKTSNVNITGPVRKKQKRALDFQEKPEMSKTSSVKKK